MTEALRSALMMRSYLRVVMALLNCNKETRWPELTLDGKMVKSEVSLRNNICNEIEVKRDVSERGPVVRGK